MGKFQKATRKQARLRLGIVGPAGSGKTFSALRIAQGLGERIALIDTENGSASKYSGDVADFDVLEMTSYDPAALVENIKAAEAEGYHVLIIDSLSHFWMGKDGALDKKDAAEKRGGNSYTAWRSVTPMHNAMIDAILTSRCHIIGTMRAKTEYVMEKDEKGKTTIRKVGLAPVQRDGMEYEFDVVGDINADHQLVVTKSRCSTIADAVIDRPGKTFGEQLLQWLEVGQPIAEVRQVSATESAGDPYDTPQGKLADALDDIYEEALAWLKNPVMPDGSTRKPYLEPGQMLIDLSDATANQILAALPKYRALFVDVAAKRAEAVAS